MTGVGGRREDQHPAGRASRLQKGGSAVPRDTEGAAGGSNPWHKPVGCLLLPSSLLGAQALRTGGRRPGAGGLLPAAPTGPSPLGAPGAGVRCPARQAGQKGRGGSTRNRAAGRPQCCEAVRTEHTLRAVSRARAAGAAWAGGCGGCSPGDRTRGANEGEASRAG